MKKNKIFYVSYFISCLFVIMFMVYAIHVKFVLFSDLIPNILNFINWDYNILYLIISDVRTPRFIKFIMILVLIRQFWILLGLFFISYITIFFCGLLKKLVIVWTIIFLLIISLILLFISTNFIIKVVSIMLLIYSLFIFLNYILGIKNIVNRFLILIPIVNICVVPIHSIEYLSKRIQKIAKFLAVIGLVLFELIGLFFLKAEDYNNFTSKFSSIKEDTYSISPIGESLVLNGGSSIITSTLIDNDKCVLEYFDKRIIESNFVEGDGAIVVNEERNEIYAFNKRTTNFFVLDTNFNKIKETNLAFRSYDLDIDTKEKVFYEIFHTYGFERIRFDNKTKTIFIVFEDNPIAFILDMDTLDILKKYDIGRSSDYIIFNEISNSYVCTFWMQQDYFVEIPADINHNMNVIKAFYNQGYCAYSKSNKEVYVSFYHKGLIGVYDAETYQFKRFIKSNYAVKDITYNEDLNILMAPSYLTGYCDIFLMDGTDTLLYRDFVCFLPREMYYDIKNKMMFCTSSRGLKLFKIDLPYKINQISKKS